MSKSQVRAPNLDRAGNDVTVTAADLQTLIRSPSLGKGTKGGTDNPFVFPFLLSCCPIKTRVITAESYSDIRHWDSSLHNNVTETC